MYFRRGTQGNQKMFCSCNFLQPAETRWRVLRTCILPVSMERKGVLPWRQGLLSLPSVVSSLHKTHNTQTTIHFRRHVISELQLSRCTNWDFTPSQQSSANSFCHDRDFISSIDANFSESDLFWKVLRYGGEKWLNLIAVILGYRRREGAIVWQDHRSVLVRAKRSVCSL